MVNIEKYYINVALGFSLGKKSILATSKSNMAAILQDGRLRDPRLILIHENSD